VHEQPAQDSSRLRRPLTWWSPEAVSEGQQVRSTEEDSSSPRRWSILDHQSRVKRAADGELRASAQSTVLIHESSHDFKKRAP
jgi:uncharacterized protein (DUF427 family)